MTQQWPEVPPIQTIAVFRLNQRIKVIICHDVPLTGLTVQRKHDEKDLITKQPGFDMAVKWKDRRVVQIGILGPLLEIDRKQRKPAGFIFMLVLSAGLAQDL